MVRYYWKTVVEIMLLAMIIMAVYYFYRCHFVPFNSLAIFDRIGITLNNIHAKEQRSFDVNGRYTSDFISLGLGKNVGDMYTVYFGTSINGNSSFTPINPIPSYLQSFVLDDKYIIIAIANIDGDPDYDIWTLDEKGNIIHLVNDMLVGDNKQSCCLIYH